MLSQEHFIGYVTTTLNNTFTNNFETNGAPYDWPKYFGLFFIKRYHYQVWKTLDVNCTDIV